MKGPILNFNFNSLIFSYQLLWYNYYDRYLQLYLLIGALSRVSYMVHMPLAYIGFSAIAPSITSSIDMQQCSILSARVPVPDGAHERPR